MAKKDYKSYFHTSMKSCQPIQEHARRINLSLQSLESDLYYAFWV